MAHELVLRGGLQIISTPGSGTGDPQLTLDIATKIVGEVPAVDSSTFISKTLATGNILVGSNTNIATAVPVTGVISLSSGGITTLQAGVIFDSNVNASAGIVYSKLNLVGSIVNTDINASAAITRTKLAVGTAYRVIVNSSSGIISELAALTAARVLVSDANGQPIAANPSTTEINFVVGVTSAIQTQLGNRLSFSSAITPVTGDIIIYSGGVWTRLPIGTAGQVLNVTAGLPAWGAATANGLPTGGTVGQYLNKIDGTNYNAQWSTLTLSKVTDVTATLAQVNVLATGFYDATSSIQSQLTSKLDKTLNQNYLFVGNVSNVAVPLASGANGYILTSVGGAPTWVAPTGGAITNGSGTTAAGTAVNLGGTLTGNAAIDGHFNLTFGSTTPLALFSAFGGLDLTTFSSLSLNLSAAQLRHFEPAGITGSLTLDSTSATLVGGLAGANPHTQIVLSGTAATFTDTRATPVGLQEAADYSTNYTNLSYTNKGYVLGAKTYTGKQTFVQTTTTSPINLGGFASDPSVPLEGEISYNTTSHLLKFYDGTSWVSVNAAPPAWLLASGGTLTGVNTITSNAKNQLNFTGTWTATAAADSHMAFGGTLTAASGLGVTGYVVNPTLNAVGTSSVQVGLDVNPTFAGGTTPVNITARFQNGGVIIGGVSTFASVGTPEMLLVRRDASSPAYIGITNLNTSGFCGLNLSTTTGGVPDASFRALGSARAPVTFSEPETLVILSGLNNGINIASVLSSQISFWTNSIKIMAIDGKGNTTITQPVQTIGSLVGFSYVSGAHTTLTAGVEALAVNLNTSATVQYATGAQSILRNILVQAPTIGFVGASTITDNATFTISGAPKAGTNTTQTNTHGLLIQAGAVTSAGSAYGLTANAPTGGTVNYSAQFLGGIGVNFNQAAQSTSHTFINIQQAAHTGGEPRGIIYTGGSHTGITPSFNFTDILLNAGGGISTQFVTGNLSLRSMFQISGARLLSFVGASTITDAAAVDIFGSPQAHTNATFTNVHALLIRAAATISAGAATNSYGLTVNAQTGAVNNYSAQFLGGLGVKIRQAAQTVTHTFVDIQQSVHTGGTPVCLSVSGAAHTTLAAGVSFIANQFAFGQTSQFASNTLVTSAHTLQLIPNGFSFVTAGGVITNSSSLNIIGSPISVSNCNITNSHGILISSASAGAGTTNSYGITVNAMTTATNNYAAQFLGGRVNFAAGTTTYAPILLVSGTNTTTAVAGAVEYDGTNLFFTPSGTTRKTAALYQVGRVTAQTAANASIATWTVGANDGSFLVSANVLVTTSTTHTFTVTCSYTDEGNTARVLTLPFYLLAGTSTTSIANAAGAVPYEGVQLHIRCKASTTITIATTGTFTTVTYNAEGSITQIN